MNLLFNKCLVLFLFLLTNVTLLAQERLSVEDSIFNNSKQAFDFTEKDKIGEAIKLSNESLERATAINNDSLKAQALEVLGISHSIFGDEDIALNYHTRSNAIYKKLKDTLKQALKANQEKIELIENKRLVQEISLNKTKNYNFILVILSVLLLLATYLVFRKGKQFKMACDRAQELSKTKSKFYSEISHELRTPLYAVIELSNLLLQENPSLKQKEYLDSLKFSGNHLLALINNILELNKEESQKVQLDLVNFNLDQLINNVIDSLEFALQNRKNTIILNYDVALPKLLIGDSFKLSQVLINLISNAIKFTENGHIKINIKLEREKEDDVLVYFEVNDNGIGISEEMQENIFKEFHQEKAAVNSSYGGTGLGLSIVKNLLKIMKSDIHLKSKIGQGSSFYFNVNFKRGLQFIKKDRLNEAQLKLLKECSILIVDDNKINQMVTKKILDNYHIKNQAVSDGFTAIKFLDKMHFDCILMDLHMPNMDGYETSKLIKQQNYLGSIIALTASASEEVEDKIKLSEIDDYILKPFMIIHLLTKILESIEVKNKNVEKSLIYSNTLRN